MLLISVDVSSGPKIIKELAIIFFIAIVLVNLAYLVKSFNDCTRNSAKENCGKIDAVFKSKLSMQ